MGQVRLVEREDEPELTLHAEHVEELHDVLMLGHRRIRGDFLNPPQSLALFQPLDSHVFLAVPAPVHLAVRALAEQLAEAL